MITPEQIQRLKELYEKSTQGKWETEIENGIYGPSRILKTEGYWVHGLDEKDAELICEMYNMLPDLLEAAECKHYVDWSNKQWDSSAICLRCGDTVMNPHFETCSHCDLDKGIMCDVGREHFNYLTTLYR